MKNFIKILVFLVFIDGFLNYGLSNDIKYTFGRGLKIKNFTFGGYTAFIYLDKNKEYRKFDWEEFSLLGFWDITDNSKFFIEYKIQDIYIKTDDRSKKFSTKYYINRMYIDFLYNDYLKIRLGRFITPVGFWNPIYVIVLKWTTSDPITAIDFYPRFTTGIRVFGYLPFQNNSFEYDIVAQNNRGLNENYNSMIPKNFYIFQIKKHFNDTFSMFLSGGYYDRKDREEIVNLGGFGVKYKKKRLEVIYEYFYAKEKEKYYLKKKYSKTSYYLQVVSRIFSKNYLIGRIEYYKDLSDGEHIENYIIGWNYRPLFPISIKTEYKKTHDRINNKNKYTDTFLASFSVLF